MKFAGVDLHKQTITVCVVDKQRSMLVRRRFACRSEGVIRDFFAQLGEFEVVVEATASYEWFVELVEPLARRVVLAHPQKLRVIAESSRKSDRLDARILAEHLAKDEIPQSYRPTPRQRAHRRLVRYRCYVQRRIGAVRTKIRRILSDYNADRTDLFSSRGVEYLKTVALEAADRFVVNELWKQFTFSHRRLRMADRRLAAFAAQAPWREREDRALLGSIPGVGRITIDTVLSELADPRRFLSQKRVVAYAGLAPGQRESAGKRKALSIEKAGSRLLRWVLIQAAWRLVRCSALWRYRFDRLALRTGKKKAIVAVARRLLSLMLAILHSGQPYRLIPATR